MRPFSDIIANQIIPKALSLGFVCFFFVFLVRDVVVVVDGADVCVDMAGGGGDEAGVCVFLCEFIYVSIHRAGRWLVV